MVLSPDSSFLSPGLLPAHTLPTLYAEQIQDELNLTASTGVAPNKFLAMIASDWKKPNGLFVIQPHEIQAFLLPLSVGRIPGVGSRMRFFRSHHRYDLAA